MTSLRNGYPLEWFTGPIDEGFKCGICSLVLRDPTITKCGHVYCARCISSWAGYYGVCPECCRQVELDSLSCPLELSTIVSGLAVRCKNRPAGCKAQIRLAEKHLHEQICSYRIRRTRSGLGKLLPNFSLSQQDLSSVFKDRNCKIQHKRSKSSSGPGSLLRVSSNTVPRRSPSSVSAVFRPGAVSARCEMPVAMVSEYGSSC